MIDHAPRIRAQQQAELENAEMAELEKRAAPMQWTLIIIVVALALGGIIDQAKLFIRHYNALTAENEAMVQCLNGHLISIDNVLVSCKTHASTLVAGVQP
jgi:hypothetical protein